MHTDNQSVRVSFWAQILTGWACSGCLYLGVLLLFLIWQLFPVPLVSAPRSPLNFPIETQALFNAHMNKEMEPITESQFPPL